jgi:hypothetical protein
MIPRFVDGAIVGLVAADEGCEWVVEVGPWRFGVQWEAIKSIEKEGRCPLLGLGVLYGAYLRYGGWARVWALETEDGWLLAFFDGEYPLVQLKKGDLKETVEQFVRAVYAAGYDEFVERVVVFAPKRVECGSIERDLGIECEIRVIDPKKLCRRRGWHHLRPSGKKGGYFFRLLPWPRL